ncbi:MAG: preprotein translocase subunit YajC [Spirochaetaceae bacterium]|jgi:preprotein translocase subunit YajC|nr:preprotein translocase subunit YajC [Spirochaetaceae bacterium]
MNSVALSLLLGAPDAANGASSGSFITTLIPFALIIGIFYFLIIRPQNKKQKETQRMLSALKKGDKVVTIGGIHGVIQSVKESSVILKVDETTKLEVSRSAISTVSAEGKTEKAEKNEKAEPEEKKGEGTGEARDGDTAEKSGN